MDLADTEIKGRGERWRAMAGHAEQADRRCGRFRLYVHPSFSAGGFLSMAGGMMTTSVGFGGAAMNGAEAMAGLRSQYINPDIEVSQTFNPQEQRALAGMQGAEQAAQNQMGAAERDTRPDRALAGMQQREANAARDVFEPGARQAEEKERARQERVQNLRDTNFDQPGFE